MKHFYILILLAAALGLSGCESENPTSSNDTKKELEVLPSSITIERFKEFPIKARMTNVPLSDVYIKVDFGDNRQPRTVGAGSNAYHFYIDTGSYTITVSAYDGFNDSLLASKTIPAVVNDLPHIVNFPQDIIDTTLEMTNDGKLPPITFTIESNAPYGRFIWNFGDGSIDSTSSYLQAIHTYSSAGTYKVIVDVYDYNNAYWGSDTMICIIRIPEVSLPMLNAATRISVSFAPDTTSAIWNLMKYISPLNNTAAMRNDQTSTSEWNGNSFKVSYTLNKDFSTGTPYSNYNFSGSVSSDLKRIDNADISIYDSTLVIGGIIVRKYGYKLYNLELVAINSTAIIYRALNRQLNTFASNEYYAVREIPFASCMPIEPFVFRPGLQHPPPYAYIIFYR